MLAQLNERKRTGEIKQIHVNIKLKAVKPMLVRWVKKAFDWFQTEEGQELILKGFEKAGISRAFTLPFQREASKYPIITYNTTHFDLL